MLRTFNVAPRYPRAPESFWRWGLIVDKLGMFCRAPLERVGGLADELGGDRPAANLGTYFRGRNQATRRATFTYNLSLVLVCSSIVLHAT